MFCKSCGKQIDNDSIFCSSCGVKQTSISITNTVSTRQQEIQSKHQLNDLSATKYDSSYDKEVGATYVGIVLLLISLLIAFAQPIKFDSRESYAQFKVLTSIGSLFVRTIATIWVVNIIKRQNRQTFWWGLLAFFLPSIALIIVGQLSKINNYNGETGNVEKNDYESLVNSDTMILIKYLEEYPESMWYKRLPKNAPLIIVNELKKREVRISGKMIIGLDKYSIEEGYNSYSHMTRT